MENNIPFIFMQHALFITRSDIETDGPTEEYLTILEYDQAYMYPSITYTEDVFYEHRLSPIFALGIVLAIFVVISLCSAIYHHLKESSEQRESITGRITPQDLPDALNTFSLLNATWNTSPKHISPTISRFPPDRTHLCSTPVPNFQRTSPESIEMFEPWESYKFIHPDIPGELLEFRRSTPESDVYPLHERTIHIQTPSTDGVPRRRLSFLESMPRSASDSDDLSSKD